MSKKSNEKLQRLTCHARDQKELILRAYRHVPSSPVHHILPCLCRASFGKQPRRGPTPTGNGVPPCVTAIDSTSLRGGAI